MPLPIIAQKVSILGDTGGATRIELSGASAGSAPQSEPSLPPGTVAGGAMDPTTGGEGGRPGEAGLGGGATIGPPAPPGRPGGAPADDPRSRAGGLPPPGALP